MKHSSTNLAGAYRRAVAIACAAALAMSLNGVAPAAADTASDKPLEYTVLCIGGTVADADADQAEDLVDGEGEGEDADGEGDADGSGKGDADGGGDGSGGDTDADADGDGSGEGDADADGDVDADAGDQPDCICECACNTPDADPEVKDEDEIMPEDESPRDCATTATDVAYAQDDAGLSTSPTLDSDAATAADCDCKPADAGDPTFTFTCVCAKCACAPCRVDDIQPGDDAEIPTEDEAVDTAEGSLPTDGESSASQDNLADDSQAESTTWPEYDQTAVDNTEFAPETFSTDKINVSVPSVIYFAITGNGDVITNTVSYMKNYSTTHTAKVEWAKYEASSGSGFVLKPWSDTAMGNYTDDDALMVRVWFYNQTRGWWRGVTDWAQSRTLCTDGCEEWDDTKGENIYKQAQAHDYGTKTRHTCLEMKTAGSANGYDQIDIQIDVKVGNPTNMGNWRDFGQINWVFSIV